MKRALAVLAVLMCAACASAETPDSPAEETSASRGAAERDAFLRAIRANEAISVADISDDELVTAGEAVCGALDRGVEPMEVLTSGIVASGDFGTVVLGTAASTLCREHMSAVQELADQL